MSTASTSAQPTPAMLALTAFLNTCTADQQAELTTLWTAKKNNPDDEGANAAFDAFQAKFFPVEEVRGGEKGQGKRKAQLEHKEGEERDRASKKAKATVGRDEGGGSGKGLESTAAGGKKTRKDGGAKGKERAVDRSVDLAAEVEGARKDLTERLDCLIDLADVQRKALDVQAAAIQELKGEVVNVEVKYKKEMIELQEKHEKMIKDLREELEELKVQIIHGKQ